VVVLANGKVAAQGTPEELRQTSDPLIYQFVNGLSEGPVHFHYPAKSIAEDFSSIAP
jgi:phospholipid/cholesterol/gamma-HCH transport system ATP-binding protein